MTEAVKLPIIDLSSSDSISTANLIRQACTECGFFYLVNHGVEKELVEQVFHQSSDLFSLPLEDKLKLAGKEQRGYIPLFFDSPNPVTKGNSKESFYIGPVDDVILSSLNEWPSQDMLPSWRSTMESYYRKVLWAVKRLISLISLALNLDEEFFEKAGAPTGFVRLLHYPGSNDVEETYGVSAHSDYGLLTLLVSNGVPGLQVCKEKSRQPQIWEDVLHIDGAFIVNIGDVMERCTNCLFRSTFHRVAPKGQERYSVAFFLDPNEDFMVECLESCCSEASPARFSPILAGDYLKERLRLAI